MACLNAKRSSIHSHFTMVKLYKYLDKERDEVLGRYLEHATVAIQDECFAGKDVPVAEEEQGQSPILFTAPPPDDPHTPSTIEEEEEEEVSKKRQRSKSVESEMQSSPFEESRYELLLKRKKEADEELERAAVKRKAADEELENYERRKMQRTSGKPYIFSLCAKCHRVSRSKCSCC